MVEKEVEECMKYILKKVQKREINRRYCESDKGKKKNKEYNNSKKKKENYKKWRKENYEKYRKMVNGYKRSSEKVKANRKKYMENPINKLRVTVCNRMKYKIGHNNINCEELVGCSWGFLVKYIEEQFEKQTAKYGVNKYTGEAMSWSNYGAGNNCFHIDHIKPYREYDMNNLDERKMVCVYTNIQPLWSYDNVLKDCR